MTAASPALIDLAVETALKSGHRRPTIIRRAIEMFMDGSTINETARTLEIGKNTAKKFRDIIRDNGFRSRCDCGRPYDHRGRCSGRVARGFTVDIATVANFLTQRDVEIKRLSSNNWMVDKRVLDARGMVEKANRLRADMGVGRRGGTLAPFILRAG